MPDEWVTVLCNRFNCTEDIFWAKVISRLTAACAGYSIQQSDINDIVQKVLISLIERLRKGIPEGSSTWSDFSKYVYQSGRNAAFAFLKQQSQRKKHLTYCADFPDDLSKPAIRSISAPNSEVLKDLSNLQINALISLVPECERQYRIILTLHLQGFNQQQIAEQLGFSRPTVGRRLNQIGITRDCKGADLEREPYLTEEIVKQILANISYVNQK